MSSILVVDDEDYIRDLIEEILELQGHDAITVASAREAFKLCLHQAFDLVITDLAMPDMDGLQLIRALRAAKLDVPVLAVSGSLSGQFLGTAARLGTVGTLTKPFELPDLLAAVDKSLGRQPGQTMTARH